MRRSIIVKKDEENTGICLMISAKTFEGLYGRVWIWELVSVW